MSVRLEELYRKRASLARAIEAEEAAEARRGKPTLSSPSIIYATANLYSVTVEQVLSTSRDERVVKARWAACWLLRANGWTLPAIGRAMGRDHSTVLHACNKVDADPGMRGLLWPMLAKFEGAA